VREGLAGFNFPLLGQSFEPGHELTGGLLDFLGRETFIPVCASE